MKRVTFFLAAALVAFAGFSGSAQAVPVTFFGEDLGLGENTRLPATPNADAAQAAFLANLIGVGTEDFESIAPGTGSGVVLDFGVAGTATLSGSGFVNDIPAPSTNGFGRYPISGDRFWDDAISSGSGANLFTIDFSDPVAAFGFYLVDAGDFNGQIRLTLTNGAVEVVDVPHTVGAPGGSVAYFGLIDTDNQYTKVQFSNTASGSDAFGFDDLTVGSLQQVIPEPGAVALYGIGLLVSGVYVGRRLKS
jgi:hypothetical protein